MASSRGRITLSHTITPSTGALGLLVGWIPEAPLKLLRSRRIREICASASNFLKKFGLERSAEVIAPGPGIGRQKRRGMPGPGRIEGRPSRHRASQNEGETRNGKLGNLGAGGQTFLNKSARGSSGFSLASSRRISLERSSRGIGTVSLISTISSPRTPSLVAEGTPFSRKRSF